MSDAQLTGSERDVLREFAVQQSLEHPLVITAGANAADELRQRCPDLGDQELAAVILQVSRWATRAARRCRCDHLAVFADVVSAVSVDLAHLELHPPGQS